MSPHKDFGVPASTALETQRLLLRPIAPADAPVAFALLHGRREVLDWLIWEGPASAEALRGEYATWRVDAGGGSNVLLAVLERESGELAGTLTLKSAGHPGICELGFWLGGAFHGRGLGTEFVRAATWLAFERMAATLAQAVVFVGNQASRRALERCGFALDRELRLDLSGRSQRAWHLSLERAGARRALGAWRPESCGLELEPAPAASPEGRGGVASPRTTRP